MSDRKPFRVKAKITRTVTEVVIATLDRNGDLYEIEDVLDEIEYDNAEVITIQETRDTF